MIGSGCVPESGARRPDVDDEATQIDEEAGEPLDREPVVAEHSSGVEAAHGEVEAGEGGGDRLVAARGEAERDVVGVVVTLVVAVGETERRRHQRLEEGDVDQGGDSERFGPVGAHRT